MVKNKSVRIIPVDYMSRPRPTYMKIEESNDCPNCEHGTLIDDEYESWLTDTQAKKCDYCGFKVKC